MAGGTHLKIIVDDAGRMTLEGPIDNLQICYALLELAKDVLRERAAKKARGGIEVVGSIGEATGG